MMLLRRALLLICWFLCLSTLTSRASTLLYSEQGYLEPDKSWISSIRLREVFFEPLLVKPFLQVGSEWVAQSQPGQNFDPNSSYLYVAPGLSLGQGIASLNFEWRQKAYYRISQNQPQQEIRSLLQIGREWSQAFRPSVSMTEEIYAEGLISSLDAPNLSLSGFLRLGIRYTGSSQWLFDAFVEPNYLRQQTKAGPSGQMELRPSLRVRYLIKSLSFGIISAYAVPISQNLGAVGQAQPRTAGMRALAVIGGEL